MAHDLRPENLRTSDESFGPNDWLVEEMHEMYLLDPTSVSEDWRRFFAGDGSSVQRNGSSLVDGGAPATPPSVTSGAVQSASVKVPAPPATPSTNGARTTAPAPARQPSAPTAAANAMPIEGAVVLRGAAARVVQNMTTSLSVPTATSVRTIPARLLEVNRTILNNHMTRTLSRKVSFTHIISFAVVRAVAAVPAMNSVFVPDADGKGNPGVVRAQPLGLGIAVDVEKSDGSRSLLVPVIRDAGSLDFRAFCNGYDALINKVRTNKLSPDDFAGGIVTITNPGTIGTEHSIPRLMSGQALIIGVGTLGYPVEFEGSDPVTLASLGVSKTVTLTSTYDHRVIQGAESGLFLKTVHDLLLDSAFYQELFDSMDVPYTAVKWLSDHNGSANRDSTENIEKQVHVQTLINNYRVRGHRLAVLDPLGLKKPEMSPELDPANYGLTVWDLSRQFFTDGLAGTSFLTLDRILGILRDAYCRTVGIEYGHVQDPEEKRWIQAKVEGVKDSLTKEDKLHILERLNAAEAFEKFLSTRYIGHKRFGLEGAESAIVFLDQVLCDAHSSGLGEAVIGMAHRGRLNVLTNIVGKEYGDVFREFEGNLDPDAVQGSGDVKYHKGYEGEYRVRDGETIHVVLSPNPSHLEAVDPVVEGIVRAKQDIEGNVGAFPTLPILVHGDAAFAGQGVVAETLNLSLLRGYRTGGTIHLIINNQVGFTTNPMESRSSLYATDVAKNIHAPIFHVNGDDPEAVSRMATLALAYRQQFSKDVVVDMVCYRKHGHNEGDEPSYTHPLMYAMIDRHDPVRKLYTESLIKRGEIDAADEERALEDFLSRLQGALDQTRAYSPPAFQELPPERHGNEPLETVETGVSAESLRYILDLLTEYPEGFTVHPKLVKQFEQRAQLFDEGLVDWSLGEAFAFGTLMLEGADVRFAGQDSRRGTFSHRHSALVDNKTAEIFIPLMGVRDYHGDLLKSDRAGRFMIYDSSLSEYAALGFEYGYSLVQTGALVCWEAQFGDFANGAQIIIDQFIAAGEDKWDQSSSLVMLLPHGYEGQGAEHSSARVERFLSLAAGTNMIIANPTSSAQLFHLLRAQVRRGHRRPLVVPSPKSLLRARQSRSPVSAFLSGSFRPVIDDMSISEPESVTRLVLCNGKVSYDAFAARDRYRESGTAAASAIIRVEQLFPWPGPELKTVIDRYPNVTELIWLQEEPENMGAWNFVLGRIYGVTNDKMVVTHVSRRAAGSPATGISAVHLLEQEDILHRSLATAQ